MPDGVRRRTLPEQGPRKGQLGGRYMYDGNKCCYAPIRGATDSCGTKVPGSVCKILVVVVGMFVSKFAAFVCVSGCGLWCSPGWQIL